MNKTTQTWVQLVCLLSISALLAQQAGATNAAVYVSMFVSGGDAEQRTAATYGGFGGSVIVKTGVGDINPGDGSDGPLTHDITLTSGTHNYTYVYMDIEHGGTTPPTITIDGDVTINCQGFFAPAAVVGKFVPDQGRPPHVRINAGHPIITVFGTQISIGSHSASLQMSARNTSPAPVNSDGTGMDGGSVEFFTSEAGDIFVEGVHAWGGTGRNGGNGGDAGEVKLVATGGNILAGGMFVYGGPAIGATDAGYGGSGGDGGSIYLSGIKITNTIPSSPILLSADGGDGFASPISTIDHPRGGKGGDGGNGGGIAVCGRLSEGGSFPATAKGGDGKFGGHGYSFSGISGSGRDGYPGGDGGDGGAPGVIVGLSGTTTPGNGGDGGRGGIGEAGHLLPPPFGYDSPGGNGGAGGNGGKSGGAGAQPGNGGIGGTGGAGNPDGTNGPAGAVGGDGDRPPPKPPTDGTGHYTYVLCAGIFDCNPTNIDDVFNADRGAELVCNAFLRLPNISLTAKAVKLRSYTPGNSTRLIQAINEARTRLQPRDNFIFYINCHGATNEPDVELCLSRYLVDPTKGFDDYISNNRVTTQFEDAPWPSIHKAFIMDCCHAGWFWTGPMTSQKHFEHGLDNVAILSACAGEANASYGGDANGVRWGFLGQSLETVLNRFSTAMQISWYDLAESTKQEAESRFTTNASGVFSKGSPAYYEDVIPVECGVRATNVGMPVWTNSSDFAMTLVLVTNAPPTISFQPTNIAAIVGTNVQFLVAAGGTEPLRYQWYFNGGTISRATNTTLVLSNVQPTSAGTYRVQVTNAFGRVTSSNAVLTVIVPDTTKPTNTITAPMSGQRWSNSVFTVTGMARDNVQVSNIWYQLNGLGWNPATTTNHWTNWTASVTLLPGTNTVRAYALDTSGNSSLTNTVSFTYVVSDRLRVVISGQGTLSPNYSNAVLEIGRGYSMTASAAAGFAFTNWVVSTNWVGSATTNNATVRFMMQSNLTLQVNFADVTKPTITITSPTAGQKMTNALVNVKGTASDNWRVGSVQYQLNSGAWGLTTTTNGWTNWTAVLPLIAGTNVIKAYAVDLGGNASTTNTVSVVSSNTFNLRLGFSSAQPMASNGLQLSLEVSRGISGRVELSTNLKDWTTLTSFISTNTTMQFRDSAATNYNRRFYRAVVP
jgi:hypothetical protein